jgi:hypothetical protein
VKRIQIRLKKLGFYKGPIDSNFGGGTDAAIRAYQGSKSLAVDGKVGPITWASLFDSRGVQLNVPTFPEPAILQESLGKRCLALTGSFETGKMPPECFAALTGDFDGQGLSFGALQWNFGQQTLQPILIEMKTLHSKVLESIFAQGYEILIDVLEKGFEEQMAWVQSIQHPIQHFIHQPWRGYLKTLGRTPEFQGIQMKHAEQFYQRALKLCQEYHLWSERAVVLMYDIVVQNGSISDAVQKTIMEEIQSLSIGLNREESEVEKMRIIANRRSEACKPRWVEDVRSRKLTCANGQGVVHGTFYNLPSQFGISLRALAQMINRENEKEI